VLIESRKIDFLIVDDLFISEIYRFAFLTNLIVEAHLFATSFDPPSSCSFSFWVLPLTAA
jgi:hypothetical protein